MRKGRSISITQWQSIVRDPPARRVSSNLFALGFSVWNGERFIGLHQMTQTQSEYERIGIEPEIHTTRLEFLPPIEELLPGVASLEKERRKRALLTRLKKDADRREHLRWLDNQSSR